MQAGDNDYYLDHAPDDTYNENGSIFWIIEMIIRLMMIIRSFMVTISKSGGA